jgi:hypothetical protein
MSDSANLLCQAYGIDLSSSVCESDLLNAEIDSWSRMDEERESCDISAICFSVSRIFRNILKSKNMSIDFSHYDDLKNIMSEFDNSIRTKNYNASNAIYKKLQKMMKHD